MSGKGAKGLIMGKSASNSNKDKDKKKPISRSSRAGLQVFTSFSFSISSFHFWVPKLSGFCFFRMSFWVKSMKHSINKE